jgi:actin related protein 2/3 complex subunit 1A/1B
VKWSPIENKFSVASSAKCVAVCHFDSENDWWGSKFVKKHKSTVLTVAWHPNNNLLLTGSSDMKARVFSVYVKGIDEKSEIAPFTGKNTFGECLAEYNVSGWVHSVTWSNKGSKFAFVAHDSTISFVDMTSGGTGEVQTLRIPFLPLSDLLYTNDNTIVAGGHDCQLVVFTNNGGTWAFSNTIDKKKDPSAAKTGGTQAAFELFKNKVEVGANTNVQALSTLHQNCITTICPYNITASGDVKEFTTSALDGKLVMWPAP